MARYTGPSCRLCRREGEKLFLKGARCYSDKCTMNRRNGGPGQHSQSRRKMSEYGLQLREKQKAKRFYGLQESQFRKYFEMADSQRGITGENLLTLLERRLDNVVYRLGLATSRSEARQVVNHSHVEVNGRKVNIPSFLVKKDDVISLKQKSKSNDKFKDIIESTSAKNIPEWLSFDEDKFEGIVVDMPTREDIDLEIAEHLIVELYSK